MCLVQYSSEEMLLFKMNTLKKRLNQAVDEYDSLTDERVVQISQELDVYVLQFQMNTMTKTKYKEVLQ
ncbi:aspartyl-phosphate phosphatase Spo0E family protein [Paenibacillus sp. 481]|uniref:aspartyl-phosphate phosphatase Spo0E family protein n=1 Tax=Paenibacillus sp. 481 TaxID=2835869 RepID=UPI001E5F8721|nr:aspartyl-phosphate phosphatase Spo0E family protein [Paenibacillus sp. 481]UHA72159.1 aspartyl-phosphate phosphatase Spo0E family protein [Paenibacillus sp. 481]